MYSAVYVDDCHTLAADTLLAYLRYAVHHPSQEHCFAGDSTRGCADGAWDMLVAILATFSKAKLQVLPAKLPATELQVVRTNTYTSTEAIIGQYGAILDGVKAVLLGLGSSVLHGVNGRKLTEKKDTLYLKYGKATVGDTVWCATAPYGPQCQITAILSTGVASENGGHTGAMSFAEARVHLQGREAMVRPKQQYQTVIVVLSNTPDCDNEFLQRATLFCDETLIVLGPERWEQQAWGRAPPVHLHAEYKQDVLARFTQA
jgi:hypothetical protein